MSIPLHGGGYLEPNEDPRKAMLIAMRAMDMHRVHPRTDYSYRCGRCGEQLGIYPSGQKIIRNNPGIEILCSRCYEQMPKTPADYAILPPGVRQEARESIDFTKRKQ